MQEIIISGRSADAISGLQRFIQEQSGLRTQTSHIVNGHADPLYGRTELPSVLILVVLDDSVAELEAYAQRPTEQRPPLVVVSNTMDTAMMRHAMRANAREFVNIDSLDRTFITLLDELLEERWGQEDELCQVVSVLNSAGGCGASMLATNLAHVSATERNKATALIDLDLQLAPLSQYLDLDPKNSLIEALQNIEDLDEVYAEAYITQHDSGLHLLAAIPGHEIVTREGMGTALSSLLNMLTKRYQRLVLDVPNHLDTLSVAALEQSDVCVIMVQQNLPSLRGATRLMDTLRFDLGITDEHIVVVLNRHIRNAMVDAADVRRSLKAEQLLTVPNHFRSVSESINMGIPLASHMPTSPVTGAILDLETHLSGDSDEGPRGLIAKTLSAFRFTQR